MLRGEAAAHLGAAEHKHSLELLDRQQCRRGKLSFTALLKGTGVLLSSKRVVLHYKLQCARATCICAPSFHDFIISPTPTSLLLLPPF